MDEKTATFIGEIDGKPLFKLSEPVTAVMYLGHDDYERREEQFNMVVYSVGYGGMGVEYCLFPVRDDMTIVGSADLFDKGVNTAIRSIGYEPVFDEIS